MPTIEIRSQVSLNDLLSGVAQLDINELDEFVNQVLTLRAKRLAPTVSEQEADLLARINHGLSFESQKRYNHLVEKRQAETLTDEEHHTLLVLIEQVELADAERVKALTQLAQLRGVSVAELMESLDIRQPAYG